MKKKESISRKQFVKNLGLGTIALAATPSIVKGAQVNTVAMTKAYPNQNSNLQIALIGAGGMGSADTDTALRHQGVKLVAVCDLYDGRLKKARSVGETTSLLLKIIVKLSTVTISMRLLLVLLIIGINRFP